MAVVGNAYVIVQAVTTGFNQQVQNAIKGINAGPSGAAVGRSFSKGFSGASGATRGLAKLRREMEQARRALGLLIEGGYFVGPALSALGTAIGALASGLFALGAQAAAAVPSLIVLPSIFTALGQAALTAKLAFGGLGKAIGSLTKQKAGVDRMPAALERLTAAQERVDAAEKRVTKTQKALTKAYEEAREEIEQLNFSAEDAAINEKKAAIELEKARETLARVQDLPPNSRARKEAELAFAEAELNLRKAKDANKDLQNEQDRVTANGTRTMDEQIRNMDSYIAAQEAAADASDDLKKANREEAKAAKEVADIKAGKGGGGGGEDPMEGLSPEAKKFAEYIASLKPKLQELRAAAGKSLFPQLEIAIENLVEKLFPRLLPNLEATGDALGKAAIKISEVITESNNLDKLDTIFKTNNDTIEKGGTIVGNLLDVFMSLLAAADPLIQRFTDWLVVLTGGWKETANANLESGKLTETFEYAGDVAAQLGRIFGNLFRTIMDIGRSAAGPGSGGQMLLDMLEGATEKFQAFVDRAQEGGRLEQYFRDVATNVGALGSLLVEVVEQILRLGDNKGFAEFAGSLQRATEGVGKMLDIFSGGMPALGKFVENLTNLSIRFTETAGLTVYFSILNKALEILNAIFGNAMVMKILFVLTAVKGGIAAFTRIYRVARFFALAVAGNVMMLKDLVGKSVSIARSTATALGNMAGNFKAARAMGLGYFQSLKMTLSYTRLGAAATKVWTGIQAAFNAVMSMNPIVLIAIAVAALIAAFVILYMKVEGFREVVDAVFGFVLDTIKSVWNWIKNNWQMILILLTLPFALAIIAVQKVFGPILGILQVPWNWVKTGWSKLKDLLSGPINLAKNIIKGYLDLTLGFIKSPFNWIVDNWNKLRGILTGPIQYVQDAFSRMKDAVINIFKGMINWVIRGWNGISFRIPSFKLGPIGYDGFTLKLPQIPELAQGGIIQPSYGGTLARIAEAGKAERIEPLDPDGLSKRDKAMIKLLAGPAGGINITVNPSPGMDEVELASLVSRQIAKQIRRGAA